MLINTFHNDLIYLTQNTPRRVVATPSFRNSVDKPSTHGASFVMSTQEFWKPITGYEGIYEVSNLGNVRSIDHYVTLFGYQKCLRKGQDRKLNQNKHGYLIVTLSKRDGVKSKTVTVHRLVATAFIPNPNNLPYINHINGIKTDNRAGNLEWCTPKENVIHAHRNGLGKPNKTHGEQRKNSKVTDAQRIEIYHLSKSGLSYEKIAKKYSINAWTVWYIIHHSPVIKIYKQSIGC